MKCPNCGAEIPTDSLFCNKCGAKVGEQQEKPDHPFKPAAGATDFGEEKVIWQGKPSPRAYGGYMIAVAALGVIFLAIIIQMWFSNLSGSRLKWVAYIELGIFLLCLGWLVVRILMLTLTRRYKLTTQRLFAERGLISRTIDELELIRVDDVSVKQGLIQRMFNVGDVRVISTDASDAELILRGISNPVEVKEHIREHTRRLRGKSIFMEHL